MFCLLALLALLFCFRTLFVDLLTSPQVSKGFGYPGGDVSLTPELSSDVTRTIFNFGMPLPGYLSPTDRYTDQEKIINNFIRQTRKVIESYDGREGVSTYWLAEILVR